MLGNLKTRQPAAVFGSVMPRTFEGACGVAVDGETSLGQVHVLPGQSQQLPFTQPERSGQDENSL
jgi:hypothetical protein